MSDVTQFRVFWHDTWRESQVAPNPLYPQGIDVDVSDGAEQTCTTALPYPARRCGYYTITCQRCGFIGAVTTAGRPDDPRSVTIACKEMAEEAPGDVEHLSAP